MIEHLKTLTGYDDIEMEGKRIFVGHYHLDDMNHDGDWQITMMYGWVRNPETLIPATLAAYTIYRALRTGIPLPLIICLRDGKDTALLLELVNQRYIAFLRGYYRNTLLGNALLKEVFGESSRFERTNRLQRHRD